jgi:glucose-1-phosphate cytidylyltransferase
MKVVLFCGGLGMRLRDYDESIPKPMVTIGYRPIMWHLMRYYARFGHKDFVLCLGYKADVIKRYFLNYDECLSNDFVMANGGQKIDLLNSDIQDWRITFADTGLATPIGERLRSVRPHLDGEELFMANYADCLSDLDLKVYLDKFRATSYVAALVTVPPSVSYHYVGTREGLVTSLHDVRGTQLRVNGGFFIFRKAIFEYLRPQEELVDGPFQRLIEDGQLMAYEHDGFWKAMDTFKEKQQLDALQDQGPPPWESGGSAGARRD